MIKYLIFLLLILFIKKKFQKTENFVNISYNPEINYVFWTGGYDSTYNICESLINNKKIVQPIYFLYNLDNISLKKLWVRRNRKQELDAMKNIRKRIIKEYPHLENNLLPTWYIKKDVPDKVFTNYFLKHQLFPTKRKVHQYEHLSRFTFNTQIPVDIGVIGIHEGSQFIKFLKKNLVKSNNNNIIPFNHPMKYLRFPLFGLSKEKMLQNAEKSNFDNILKMTWSCWFPRTNGNPCGICPMCRERIIK